MDVLPIILAGGEGKRMESELPKVLHTIQGVPMVVRVLRSVMLLNPPHILVVVGKHRDIIQTTIENFIQDTSTLSYIIQDNPMGTGHAVMCCLGDLKSHPNSKCLILSGDVPLVMPDMLKRFTSNTTDVSIVTTEMENPYGYGRVVSIDNSFHKIIEEKDASSDVKQIKLVNGGIYCILSVHLIKHLPNLSNTNVSGEYYLTDIIELIHISEKKDVYIHNIDPQFQYQICGVNSQNQLSQLENTMLNVSLNV